MTGSNRIASNTRKILDEYGIRAKKRLGQNFLIDEHVLGKIVASAEITKHDLVFEAGPGLGALTQCLAERAGRVVAIELDGSLVQALRSLLGEYANVEIVYNDILKTDIDTAISTLGFDSAKFVANLPYYITTPIIMGLLESRARLSVISVMVQKEVANRMCAEPGSKDYGALSLAVSYYAEADIAANVPRNCFIPRPEVDSAVIRLRPRLLPPIKVKDEKLMFQIIRTGFSMRRKTLCNCLHGANTGLSQLSKERLKEIIEDCGLDSEIRGEDISLSGYALLADALDREGWR